MFALYDKAVNWVSGRLPESLALLLVRVALAGIFWRSARTKVEEGSWFTISDTTYTLFQEDYAGVPLLPHDVAAVMATVGEHVFSILLVIGLFTRLSALGLFGMTMVIQFFVFPDAWWPVHIVWVSMQAILLVRGPGLFSADHLLARGRR